MNTDEETAYYEPVTAGYRSVNNAAAIAEWFVATQPDDDLPKHTTILHVDKAEAIMSLFITRLKMDVLRNSVLAWRPGTPLPAKNSFQQPLAHRDT